MRRNLLFLLLFLMMGTGGCSLKTGLRQETAPDGQVDVQLGGIESVRFCSTARALYYTVIENNNRQVYRYDFAAQKREGLLSSSYEETLEDVDTRGDLLVTTDRYDVQGDILLLHGKKEKNLGHPFVKEMMPRFSPDGSLIAALVREKGKTSLAVFDREGNETFRSEFSGADDLAFGEGEVYLLRGTEILAVNITTGTIRVVSTSSIPKSGLFFDTSVSRLFFLVSPG